MERDGSISTRVVERIAERRGVDPTEMRPHLYDVIDPDGLDQFFSETIQNHEESTARVEFTYDQYVVRVEESGDISITERATSVSSDEEIAANSSTD